MTTNNPSVSAEIAALEHRMEMRRARVAERYDDVKEGFHAVAGKAARSWPVLAVVGGLAAGFAIARGARSHYAAAEPGPAVRYVPANAAPVEPGSRARNLLAALVGIAATAIRIGSSHEARTLYHAFRGWRARRAHSV